MTLLLLNYVTDMRVVGYWSLTTTNLSPFGLLRTSNSYPCIKQYDCAVASVYPVQKFVLV